MENQSEAKIRIGLLTGGDDRSYALGLTTALAAEGVMVEFVGSDKLDAPELHGSPLIQFLNLRGDQRENAGTGRKVARILKYYSRLLKYAATTRSPVLHILWNNKFEFFDRVMLMLYYRLLGKKMIFTAHNVNGAKRDGRDNWLNRLTLKIQYALSHHIFVHTEKMKRELMAEFDVPENKVSIIPFGINNTSVMTPLTPDEAKARLGLKPDEKALLFFGQIAPYKGLEYLVAALAELSDEKYRLMVAGKVKQGCEEYWAGIRRRMVGDNIALRTLLHVRHIPDEEVELYFKAADVVVIPYVDIFQSGVPFLAYSFGLPVIASDVGSLKQDILEGKTGFTCKPRDPAGLAKTIETYFASDLYRQLATQRQAIRDFANEQHSWKRAGKTTREVYQNLLGQR